MTYTATATREGRWWLVEVEGVGATQGRTVKEAEDMAADLVAAMTEVPVGEVEVAIDFDIPRGIGDEVKQARDANERAVQAQRDAASRLRRAVSDLRDAGLSGKDIAALLHISPQRVSQLAKR